MSINEGIQKMEQNLNNTFKNTQKSPLAEKNINKEYNNKKFLDDTMNDKENNNLHYNFYLNKGYTNEPDDIFHVENQQNDFKINQVNSQDQNLGFDSNRDFSTPAINFKNIFNSLNKHLYKTVHTDNETLKETSENIEEQNIFDHGKNEQEQNKCIEEIAKRETQINYEKLQKELDKLKEIHQRMFAVKGKIYQAVEKEIDRFKKIISKKNDMIFNEKNLKIEHLCKENQKLKEENENLRKEKNKYQTVYCKLKQKMKNNPRK